MEERIVVQILQKDKCYGEFPFGEKVLDLSFKTLCQQSFFPCGKKIPVGTFDRKYRSVLFIENTGR